MSFDGVNQQSAHIEEIIPEKMTAKFLKRLLTQVIATSMSANPKLTQQLLRQALDKQANVKMELPTLQDGSVNHLALDLLEPNYPTDPANCLAGHGFAEPKVYGSRLIDADMLPHLFRVSDPRFNFAGQILDTSALRPDTIKVEGAIGDNLTGELVLIYTANKLFATLHGRRPLSPLALAVAEELVCPDFFESDSDNWRDPGGAQFLTVTSEENPGVSYRVLTTTHTSEWSGLKGPISTDDRKQLKLWVKNRIVDQIERFLIYDGDPFRELQNDSSIREIVTNLFDLEHIESGLSKERNREIIRSLFEEIFNDPTFAKRDKRINKIIRFTQTAGSPDEMLIRLQSAVESANRMPTTMVLGTNGGGKSFLISNIIDLQNRFQGPDTGESTQRNVECQYLGHDVVIKNRPIKRFYANKPSKFIESCIDFEEKPPADEAHILMEMPAVVCLSKTEGGLAKALVKSMAATSGTTRYIPSNIASTLSCIWSRVAAAPQTVKSILVPIPDTQDAYDEYVMKFLQKFNDLPSPVTLPAKPGQTFLEKTDMSLGDTQRLALEMYSQLIATLPVEFSEILNFGLKNKIQLNPLVAAKERNVHNMRLRNPKIDKYYNELPYQLATMHNAGMISIEDATKSDNPIFLANKKIDIQQFTKTINPENKKILSKLLTYADFLNATGDLGRNLAESLYGLALSLDSVIMSFGSNR